MSVLCKLIGHKWTQRRRYRIDDMSMEDTVLFGCCLRCGVDAPRRLANPDGDEPKAYSPVDGRRGKAYKGA